MRLKVFVLLVALLHKVRLPSPLRPFHVAIKILVGPLIKHSARPVLQTRLSTKREGNIRPAAMPLWVVYHTESTFQDKTTRDAFAADITKAYNRLPPFYVIVNFVSLQSDRVYRGGVPVADLDKPFVRLVVTHLAVHAKDAGSEPDALSASYLRVRTLIDGAIKEHIVDKGYHYEYAVTEEDRHLWKIDGFRPPKFGSESMKMWKEGGKAVAYGDEDLEPL